MWLPGKANTTSRKILDAAYHAGFTPVPTLPATEPGARDGDGRHRNYAVPCWCA